MDDAEYELMESISKDCLSLIRLSIFIIAVFSTIAAYMAQSANQDPPNRFHFHYFWRNNYYIYDNWAFAYI